MGFLGYQKDEIREYNDKRCCGLWFIIIGVVIIVSAIFGGIAHISQNFAVFLLKDLPSPDIVD